MDTRDPAVWDERYAGSERLFSGNVNGALVTEAAGLPPGQALDVGCGEGADARWLAQRGWRVTAIDISRVALQRAAEDSKDENDRISWTRADLLHGTGTLLPAEAFDLVSAQYFPLPREAGERAVRTLLSTVAPGGTLLYVGHHLADMRGHEHDSDFDPDAYYQPSDIAALLGDGWTVEVDETRPRTAEAPPGTHHVNDDVLKARRTG